MKRQFIACRDCNAVIAQLSDAPDGRRLLKWSFGAPVLTLDDDGDPTAVDLHSQHFTVDLADELADCTDSFIDMECACADGGKPRTHNVAVRRTVEKLGNGRSIGVPLD